MERVHCAIDDSFFLGVMTPHILTSLAYMHARIAQFARELRECAINDRDRGGRLTTNAAKFHTEIGDANSRNSRWTTFLSLIARV